MFPVILACLLFLINRLHLLIYGIYWVDHENNYNCFEDQIGVDQIRLFTNWIRYNWIEEFCIEYKYHSCRTFTTINDSTLIYWIENNITDDSEGHIVKGGGGDDIYTNTFKTYHALDVLAQNVVFVLRMWWLLTDPKFMVRFSTGTMHYILISTILMAIT